MFGNIDMLRKHSKLWDKIAGTLEENGSVVKSLQLRCDRHREITTVRLLFLLYNILVSRGFEQWNESRFRLAKTICGSYNCLSVLPKETMNETNVRDTIDKYGYIYLANKVIYTNSKWHHRYYRSVAKLFLNLMGFFLFNSQHRSSILQGL